MNEQPFLSMALTFERLSAQSDLMTSVQDAREPTLLCDCWGVVRAANASALSFVAVQFGINEAQALGLRLREPGGERPELAQAQPHQRLFMGRVEMLIFSPENPDTPLEPNGAVRWDDWTPIGTMDLLLTPLPSGAFWVRFGPHVRSRPGSVSLQVLAQRFLRQMVALNRSVELLRNEEEVVELFATTLTDLLGDVGLVVQLQAEIDSGMMVNFIRPFGGELHIEPDPVRWLSPAEEDTLPEDALMLAGAVRGCRFRLDATGRSLGVLQVESCDDALKLTFEEREMILLFAQHLSMALSRHQASLPTASRDAQSASSVSGSYMLLNAIDALVIICDTQRRIRAVNRAFRRVVGRGRDRATDGAFIGQDLLALVTHEDAHMLRHAAAQVMGSKASQTIRLKLRVGEEPYTMHLSHLGTPGGVTGFSAVCYRNAPNLAEDRLGSSKSSRAAEAQHRLGESQRLIALGRLAIGLAHELKSPMTTILSYADYLLSKYRDSLFEARDSERLERIISDVERMDQSVRDLITFAQTDQDNAEQVGLHALMRDAVAMSGPIMHNIPIRYVLTSEDDRIYARPGHVRHIFINLLRNAAVAMENSPDGSAITLKTYREGGCFVVEVQDQGCGIPEADLERIFEPFFSTRRSSGGSGIGLAVVRMLALRQRASVQVTSQVGVGSAFLVSFPASDTTP